MDATKLAAIVGVILALSIASERLVEIVKGFIPRLDKEDPDLKAEGSSGCLAGGCVAGVGPNQAIEFMK